MTLQAAFIFLSPNSDSEFDRAVVITKDITLTAIAASDYSDACRLANKLAKQGTTTIELCGGFGNQGLTLVSKAVEGLVNVGAVRFDYHPELDAANGDTVFNS